MRIRLVALVAALVLLLPAATALAQDGNPFDGSLPPAQPTPAPTAEPVRSSADDQVGRDTLWIIGGALLVAFIGIGMWISRDAKRNLPAHEREELERERAGAEARAHKHERRAKAKARAKGRAQRQARKTARKTRR